MAPVPPPTATGRVTLSDVAAAADVSAATVSRVLHGGAAVKPDVGQRVRRAADELGYSVNRHARSLRRGRDEAIGIVVEDFTIPYFGAIVSVAEKLARARDFGVIIATAGTGSTTQESAVRALVSRNVSGLLISNGAGPAPSDYLRQVAHGLPAVVVDAPQPDLQADSVTVDNRGGAQRATAHLIGFGHRDIAFVGSGRSARTVAEREAGYRQALLNAGLPVREDWVVWAGHEPSLVHAHVEAALHRLPTATAVFSSGARTTLGTLSALKLLPGRELAFIGFDDIPGAEAFVPGLTVIDQHPELAAVQAMHLLFERIDGYAGDPRHIEVELDLYERGSAEQPPCG